MIVMTFSVRDQRFKSSPQHSSMSHIKTFLYGAFYLHAYKYHREVKDIAINTRRIV
uniref:Uncharacterized protein n=1 Tax=Octopus bimaculoides TaxID=37653 RepID=A0A0L8HE26_OCTBM